LGSGVYTTGDIHPSESFYSLPFSLSHPVSLSTFRSAKPEPVVAALKALGSRKMKWGPGNGVIEYNLKCRMILINIKFSV